MDLLVGEKMKDVFFLSKSEKKSPSWKLAWQAEKSTCSIGNTSSKRYMFHCHVSFSWQVRKTRGTSWVVHFPSLAKTGCWHLYVRGSFGDRYFATISGKGDYPIIGTLVVLLRWYPRCLTRKDPIKREFLSEYTVIFGTYVSFRQGIWLKKDGIYLSYFLTNRNANPLSHSIHGIGYIYLHFVNGNSRFLSKVVGSI